mmetsp:Transcript_21622/g.38815  ORF Transcript_21622/g.38815 Transcript_21622/m.38815 type:complete len:150 (+) Transcript_21622:246-695(+)
MGLFPYRAAPPRQNPLALSATHSRFWQRRVRCVVLGAALHADGQRDNKQTNKQTKRNSSSEPVLHCLHRRRRKKFFEKGRISIEVSGNRSTLKIGCSFVPEFCTFFLSLSSEWNGEEWNGMKALSTLGVRSTFTSPQLFHEDDDDFRLF